MRKKKYAGCTLKDHQAHALKLNFRKRNERPWYRIMARLTLLNVVLDKAVRESKEKAKARGDVSYD